MSELHTMPTPAGIARCLKVIDAKDYGPTHTLYAIQRCGANGSWTTEKLFRTDEWARGYVVKAGLGADYRVEAVQREIFD